MYTDYTDEENSEYNDYYSDDSSNNNNIDKEKIKKIAFFVLAFVILVIIIIIIAKGCSNNDDKVANVTDPNQIPSISINRESYSLQVGEELEIYADVLFSSLENPVVGWQTEDSNVVMIEDLGNKTALIKGVSEGTTNIVAIYRENGRLYSNKSVVTVTSKEIKLERIDIVQEDVTIAKGNSFLIQLNITPNDAQVPGLVYTSDNPSIASVSAEGRVNGLKAGTTTITVKIPDGSISDTLSVTVTDGGNNNGNNGGSETVINPTGLQMLGLSNGLKVGGTATITTQIYPTNATNRVLTWSSTNPGVATVNSNGIITGISPGTTTIVASTSNGVSASMVVTVQANTVAVQSIAINGDTSIQMNVNGAKRIFYTITPDNATNKNVTFTTSNRNIVTIDSNGFMVARSAGTAIVSVITEDGRKTASATVTVIGSTTTGSQTGSSGGTGSSSSNYGSSSDNDVACNDSLMTYIQHNGSNKGAIISQYSFGGAKAFQNMTEKPTITITQIAECINLKRLTYEIYYGTTESNVSSTVNGGKGNIQKAGDKIVLNNGDGYYKIKIIGYNSASKDFTKTYYAIVKNNGDDTTKPYVNSISASRSLTTRLTITVSVSETGSGLKYLKYCLTPSTSITCTPNKIYYTYTNYPKSTNISRSATLVNDNLPSYKKVCVTAVDASNNESTYKCNNF